MAHKRTKGKNNLGIQRPIWFKVSYVAVVVTIIGILVVVAGSILLILKNIRFNASLDKDSSHYYYFGYKLPKYIGFIILLTGCGIALFGGILYRASLIRIDRYIQQLQQELRSISGGGKMGHEVSEKTLMMEE